MNRKEITFFRKHLNQRLQDLLTSTVRNTDELEEEEKFPDLTDQAAQKTTRNFEVRMRDRERKLMVKIEEALQRLDDGNYGVCEECGHKIGVARLKARPVTTLCIDCKSDQETKERKNRGAV